MGILKGLDGHFGAFCFSAVRISGMKNNFILTICLLVGNLLLVLPAWAQPDAADLYISNSLWEFNAAVSRKTGVVVKGKYQTPKGHWRRFSPSYARSGQHQLKIVGHPSWPQSYTVKIQGKQWVYHLPRLDFATDYYVATPKGVTEGEYEVLEVPGGGGMPVHHPGRQNGFLRMKRE